MHHFHALGDHGEGTDTQKVDLDQAQPLNAVEVVLGGDNALGSQLERHQVGQRPRSDDDTARMYREVARMAVESPGSFQGLPFEVILGGGQQVSLGLVDLVPHAGVEEAGDLLGDRVNAALGNAVGLGDLAPGGSGA